MADMKMVAGPVTSGAQNRAFLRRKAYSAWRIQGCMGVQGLQRQQGTNYSHCFGDGGEVLTTPIEQIQDPPNLTLTSRGNGDTLSRLETLVKLANTGCAPWMLLASMDCESITDVRKPSSGSTFVSVKLGPGSIQYGNDTARADDATQNAVYAYQAQLAQLSVTHLSAPEVAQFGSVDAPAALRSLAICDEGVCSSACAPCGIGGCQFIGGATDAAWVWNSGGGNVAWTTLTSQAVGHAITAGRSTMTCINGQLFAAGADLSRGTVNPTTLLPEFTAASFVGAGGASISPTGTLTNPVMLGSGRIGIAGGQGTFYVSEDGITFVRIIAPDALEPDFVRLCVAEDGTVYAYAIDGDDAVYFMYSTTNGKTWITMEASPVAGQTFVATTIHSIWCAANEANFVINGDHYVTDCATTVGGPKVYRAVAQSGGPNVTNVGTCDEGDMLVSVAVSAGVATLRWTVDGFTDSLATSIIGTVADASANTNAMACCKTPSGNKLVIAIGPTLWSVQTYRDLEGEVPVGV